MAVLGQALRGRSRARFVGVTGSTGKTSTKDILAALCAAVAPTVSTEGSYNAELGVPLTLGRLEPETEICIVEMGMRGFGQIADLCEIVRPHVGVISAVGPVHLELVGSVDGVARSKAELVEALPPDGIAIVPVSAELEPHLRADIEILRVPPGRRRAARGRRPRRLRRAADPLPAHLAPPGPERAHGADGVRGDGPAARPARGGRRDGAAVEVARRGARPSRRRLRRQRRLQREPDVDGGGAAASGRARSRAPAARDSRRHGRARRPRRAPSPRDRRAGGRARDRAARGRRPGARLRRGGLGARRGGGAGGRARARRSRATPSSSRPRVRLPSKASPRPWRTTRA